MINRIIKWWKAQHFMSECDKCGRYKKCTVKMFDVLCEDCKPQSSNIATNGTLNIVVGVKCASALIPFLFAVTFLSCAILPQSVRPVIVSPTYDDWESGYGETSPGIIMSQLDDFDELPFTISGIDSPPYGTGEIHWVVVKEKDGYHLQFQAENWDPCDTIPPKRYPRDGCNIREGDFQIYTAIPTSPSYGDIEHLPELTYHDDPIIRMSDLIEYETECYNDSTKVWEHTFEPTSIMDCAYDYGCIYPHHYGWVMHHHEPTFTGFIQWLKSNQ